MARRIDASSSARPPQDPGVTFVLCPGWPMPTRRRWNCHAPEQAHGVAQAVLAAVAAVELEPGHARRQVQLVVRHQHLLGLDLPVAQRRRDDLPERFMKVAGQQPDRLPAISTLAVSPNSLLSSPKRGRAHARPGRPLNQNPALCRVRVCSGPGLPSPTMRRKPAIESDILNSRRPTQPGAPMPEGITCVLLGRPWSPALPAASGAAASTSSSHFGDPTTATSCSCPASAPGSPRRRQLQLDRWMMSPTV